MRDSTGHHPRVCRVTGEQPLDVSSAQGWQTQSEDKGRFTCETIGGLEGRSLQGGWYMSLKEAQDALPKVLKAAPEVQTFRAKQPGLLSIVVISW